MLAELAAPAISECLATLPPREVQDGVPIMVLLSPADRPFREPGLAETVLAGLQHRLAGACSGGLTAFGAGRTGLMQALHKASELLSTRSAAHAVIVGVDTFLRQAVAEAYMAEVKKPAEAAQDLMWALINSPGFLFNR